jgi:hypothetical protein
MNHLKNDAPRKRKYFFEMQEKEMMKNLPVSNLEQQHKVLNKNKQ